MGSVEQVHLYTEEHAASNGMRDLLKGKPISLHDESLTGHPQLAEAIVTFIRT